MAKNAKSKSQKPQRDDKSRLGVLLSELRGKRKLSMQKLAQATGISAAYICRIESGERHPSRELLQNLADVLLPESSQVEKDELLIAAGFAPVNFRNFMGRQDVLSIYQKALSENPQDFRSYISLVLSLIRSNQHEQARKQINEGMQQFDDMVQLQALMAALELSKQNFDQAVRFQQEALRYYELETDRHRFNLKLQDLLLGLGVMHFELGHTLAYRRSAAQESGDIHETERLGTEAMKALTEAGDVFKRALDVEPTDVYILDELARVYFTMAYIQSESQADTYWRSSIDAFERAICSPDKQSLGYHSLLQSTAFLALAYSKCGLFDKAWFTISIVEACLPNFWLIHYIKACYFGLKIQKEFQGQKSQASEPLFQNSLVALEKAMSINDNQNHAREEAMLDPDLMPLRREYSVEFQTLISKGGAAA